MAERSVGAVKRASVLGAGWLGLPLAAHLAGRGLDVRASTTSPEKLPEIERAGATAHLLRVGEGGIEGDDVAAFFSAEALIVTIPPSGTADYVAAARAIAEAAQRHGASQTVMTSSTSVYPDLCRTVTEDDAGPRPGYPLQRNGDAVLAAEEVYRAALDATVLRLAGLYGYGRHPARYLAGREGLPGGDAPVNLVHRDDVIAALVAVLEGGGQGGVFNVCADGHPPRRNFYPTAARALGLAPPSFAEGEGGGWKEVSSERLKRALGFGFRYPDPLQPAP